MSTTTTLKPITAPLNLCDVLTAWRLLDPGLTAPADAVAGWFECGVKLLALITADHSHPDYFEACGLAAEFSHAVTSLRGNENAEDVR
ncbi:hypothetical protein [Lentzea sp. CA-135723]|uniref:hypothetical protein n=1 Tax=Lentzea sp. CA-135723 TaxID=3239950 RepID=UPI003D94C6B5